MIGPSDLIESFWSTLKRRHHGTYHNISGISGVATKTSYAMFLLHALFESGTLGPEAANTRSLIFNVKGEDLLFLDKPNA